MVMINFYHAYNESIRGPPIYSAFINLVFLIHFLVLFNISL